MAETTAGPGGNQTNTTTIVIVVVLVSIVLLLLITIVVVALLLVYRRRMLCFKRRLDQSTLLQSDLERYGPIRKKKKHGRSKNFDRRKQKRGKHKRKAKYHSLGKAPRFPKSDPFTNKFLENPLIADDEFDMDWTNPAFDSEGARVYDATIIIQSWYRMIRVRVPYLQLREATVLAQSLYRGLIIRRLVPQLKKEKQQRDQQRKKQAGWKKKGTLAALKFFDVKGYGFAEVEQMYGLDTTRSAAEQLKNLYGGKGQMKLKLFISVKGIKLFDHQTMKHYATVKVSSVSFCTLDPKNKKLFAFINKKRRRKFCHVFQANEHDAQKMVETMAEAFEFTYKRVERRREQRETGACHGSWVAMNELIEFIEHYGLHHLWDIDFVIIDPFYWQMERLAHTQRQKAFHRRSQELDVEVASMIEMAETASVTADSVKRSSQDDQAASSPSETSLTTKSTENLIPDISSQRHSHSNGKASNLVISHKDKQQKKASSHEESFDPQKVDAYFTDISEGVQSLASTLERESKKAAELKRKNPPPR